MCRRAAGRDAAVHRNGRRDREPVAANYRRAVHHSPGPAAVPRAHAVRAASASAMAR